LRRPTHKVFPRTFDSFKAKESDYLPSNTAKLLTSYKRPWKPRSAEISEASAAVNSRASPISRAILVDRVSPNHITSAWVQAKKSGLLDTMTDASVRELEASVDALLAELHGALASSKQAPRLSISAPPEAKARSAAKPAQPPRGVARPPEKQRPSSPTKSPTRKATPSAQEKPLEWEEEAVQHRLTATQRVEQKLDELRTDPNALKKLNHLALMHQKGYKTTRIEAMKSQEVNHMRINRLALKVMAMIPLPGGDACDYDYEVRRRSPPIRPSCLHSRAALPSAFQEQIPKWKSEIERFTVSGGAPYPRGVEMSQVRQRRDDRKKHADEVVQRKAENFQRIQAWRVESAERHDRRIAEAQRLQKETAARELLERRLKTFMTISTGAMIFHDIRQAVLDSRKIRAEKERREKAVLLIYSWWARVRLKKRQTQDIGRLMRLKFLVRPWLTSAKEKVRKHHASIVKTLLNKLDGTNQVMIALRTFRHRVVKIQAHWRAAIKARQAKLNVLYLQWLRYETNLLKERRRQDAEYERRLKRELQMMHPSKRKATLKRQMENPTEKDTRPVKERSEDIVDTDGISSALQDEDIHAALAASKLPRSPGHISVDLHGDSDAEGEQVEFKPKRKVKSDQPGEDGLYLNYHLLKKLGIRALRHEMTPAELEKKRREEEEEEYRTRRVPKDIKSVICQIVYRRAKLKFARDVIAYQEELARYNSNAPFEKIRLELLEKAGLPAIPKMRKPVKPHVKIILDKNAMAFIHSKGVRMMQVREAEDRQRQADLEALMADG